MVGYERNVLERDSNRIENSPRENQAAAEPIFMAVRNNVIDLFRRDRSKIYKREKSKSGTGQGFWDGKR